MMLGWACGTLYLKAAGKLVNKGAKVLRQAAECGQLKRRPVIAMI
jgi:hypothetical protein